MDSGADGHDALVTILPYCVQWIDAFVNILPYCVQWIDAFVTLLANCTLDRCIYAHTALCVR